MKVTVSKYLNVRVGSPRLDAPNYQYLAPGSIIEVDAKLYEGQNYDGNTLWYKDLAGNYYWSGGIIVNFNENNVLGYFPRADSESKIENTVFDFSKELKNSIEGIPSGNGEDVTIAILDSGIDTRFPSLGSKIIKQKNYQFDYGRYPHATQVAGFLVANNNLFTGLCSNSKLIDLRVSNNNGNIVGSAVVKALEYIRDWNMSANLPFCDIINMSLEIKHELPKLQSCIDDLVDQGVIIIVAGTGHKELNSIAKLNGVIPVGTFKGYRFEKLKQQGFYSELIISFLNKGVESTSQYPDYKIFKDSSAFTAITSGLVAKFLSSQNISKSIRRSKVIEFLENLAVPIQHETHVKPLKPYKS